MCWGGRVPFLLGLLVGETQASNLRGWVGYSREEDMVQVLESPLFISYRHHPRPLKQGLAHAICTSSHCPGLCRPRGAPPWQDRHAQKWHSIFACPVLGILQIFLLACPSATWPTLSPDTFRYVPIRHWRRRYQALRIGRRARPGSHTAGRWDTHSCACHTWYRLPCGHIPAEHSQWVSPCRSYTGSPPGQMALLPLYRHRAEKGQRGK